ncbi:MAG: hypothetical protein LUG66_07440 [Clostridiales bacterium]|nr:hypothetical protein [Clostridiales bacterium]
MTSNQGKNTTFSLLGTKYDMFEEIYGTKGWKGKCNFLELKRTPICCAVTKNHRLAKEKSLFLKDLNGEYAVMPIEGFSYELDALRAEINKNYPTIGIIYSKNPTPAAQKFIAAAERCAFG